MGAVVEEIVFVLYALVLVILLLASIFVIVKDYHALQKHHEPSATVFTSILGILHVLL